MSVVRYSESKGLRFGRGPFFIEEVFNILCRVPSRDEFELWDKLFVTETGHLLHNLFINYGPPSRAFGPLSRGLDGGKLMP